MNSKKYIALVLTLVLVLLTTSTVSAKNERIEFTFDEYCDVDTIKIAREIMNGQGNYLAKGWTQTCYEAGSIPEVTGTLTLSLNLNAVGNGVWLFVAKGRFETKEGGVWVINSLYPWPSPDAQFVGRGEGLYEGLQIFGTGFPGGQWTGYIVDPGR